MTCGQRWGWTADKSLSVAQELYDRVGKKLITYSRAEARHLAESQIADVPTIPTSSCRLSGRALTQHHPSRVATSGSPAGLADALRACDCPLVLQNLPTGRLLLGAKYGHRCERLRCNKAPATISRT
jgi:hypothetical protein